mmetsp:Transcript_11794/g.41672  ORF Transcript_11794/g.41672 Transcript_11794/m.41672 type:complete len:354 (+) Transcript_11794:599-1660(+)
MLGRLEQRGLVVVAERVEHGARVERRRRVAVDGVRRPRDSERRAVVERLEVQRCDCGELAERQRQKGKLLLPRQPRLERCVVKGRRALDGATERGCVVVDALRDVAAHALVALRRVARARAVQGRRCGANFGFEAVCRKHKDGLRQQRNLGRVPLVLHRPARERGVELGAEHRGVRLFDLVEDDDGPRRFYEEVDEADALLEPGRGAEECVGVLLRAVRLHGEPDDRAGAVRLGHELGEPRLADAGDAVKVKHRRRHRGRRVVVARLHGAELGLDRRNGAGLTHEAVERRIRTRPTGDAPSCSLGMLRGDRFEERVRGVAADEGAAVAARGHDAERARLARGPRDLGARGDEV